MTRSVEKILWTLALGCMAFAVAAWSSARRPGREPLTGQTPAMVLSSARALPRTVAIESLTVASATIVESDVFRTDRRPAAVAFDPELQGTQPSPMVMSRPPRPELILRGIIGGPPWEAVLDGVPGRDGGAVVRPGQRIGELTVRSVRRDTVVVQGADTTWRLTVKKPW